MFPRGNTIAINSLKFQIKLGNNLNSILFDFESLSNVEKHPSFSHHYPHPKFIHRKLGLLRRFGFCRFHLVFLSCVCVRKELKKNKEHGSKHLPVQIQQ